MISMCKSDSDHKIQANNSYNLIGVELYGKPRIKPC